MSPLNTSSSVVRQVSEHSLHLLEPHQNLEPVSMNSPWTYCE